MAQKIAIVSTKGGVGKTSVVYHSSVVLADEGYKVLVCDMDAQADATDTLLGDEEPVAVESLETLEDANSQIYNAIVRKRPLAELIQQSNHKNISVLGAGMDLYDWDEPLRKALNPGARLRNALKPVEEQFDFIMMDCPPRPDWGTKMAMLAASSYLVVVDASKKAIWGLQRIERLAAEARDEGGNPGLEFLGAVMNKYQPRTKLDQGYDQVYQHMLGDKFLRTHIPQRKPYQMAHSASEPITSSKSHSELADIFKQLLNEIGVWPVKAQLT